MSLFKRRRSLAPKSLNIAVQFEPDGRVYTYTRTLDEFADMMRDRWLLRGDIPHRAWFVENGEETEIAFDVGNK